MSLQETPAVTKPSRYERTIEVCFAVFLRLLAVIFFAAAIYTWLQAIGFWEGPEFRFDTMSVASKIYTAVLAVILPVASVGLWTTLPWGRVIWFFAITFQSVSLIRFPDLFLASEIVLIFHLASLALYVVFQILLFVIAKKA